MIARLGAVPLFFALRIASALLLLKLMASFLPVSGFALCAQLMAFGAVLNVVAVGAAQNGIIRQSAAAVDAAALARAQGAALALWLGIGPLLVAGVAANAGRLSAVILGNGDNGRAIVALAALAVAAGPGQIWCSVLSGRMHTVGSLGAQALGLLAGTATGAWFILHGRPISAGIGFACGPLVAMTVAALLMRRAGLALALPRLRPRDMRALLRYSASIAATTAVSATLLFGLRSVYRDAFGAAALGHWLAANRISDMSSQLVGLFMTQFFVPHLTAITDMAERRRFILRCGGAGAAVTAAALLVFLAASRPLAHLFLSDAFIPAIPLIRAYMVGDFLRVWVSLAMFTALASGRPERYAAIEIGTLALMAAITFALVGEGNPGAPQYGYVAAYGLVAAVAALAFLPRRGGYRVAAATADTA